MYEIPYADPITETIDLYRRTWEDLMRQRIRFANRSVDKTTGEVRSDFLVEMSEIIGSSEETVKNKLGKLIREHPMADWLAEAKTSGARVATILSMIRNPHRFPGQRCSGYTAEDGKTAQHYLLPTFAVGTPCPCGLITEKDAEPEPCTGLVEEPRHGTGVRALWHMMGLYPVSVKTGEMRLARRREGEQSSHNQKAKTAVMMPQGIAQQFFMQGSRYAEVYYREKERLSASHPDKSPGWLDGTARVIAAKAWAGDLLTEWKKRVPLEGVKERHEVDIRTDADQRTLKVA